MDIKDFYLDTPTKRPEYMRLPINIIPQEIIDRYNLKELEEDGYIYCEIIKGMYGWSKSVKLSNDLLTSRLDKFVYFSLVVTNFGVRCEGIKHA